MPGPVAPGTILPGTDGATVEDLIRQLEKEKLMRRRAERGYCKTKKNQFGTKKENQFGTKKEKQFSQQEVKTKKPYRLN